jgi:hypothetical protein
VIIGIAMEIAIEIAIEIETSDERPYPDPDFDFDFEEPRQSYAGSKLDSSACIWRSQAI